MEALTRELSDHTPLLLNTGDAAHRGNNHQFKFELGWLTRDGFHDLVANKVWQRASSGNSPMQRWQNKIRAVRRWLRGWAKNLVGENKRKKSFLLEQLDFFDRKAEDMLLSQQEVDYKSCLHSELTKLLKEEELYWLQRSKAKRLVHGDDNTKYFQLLANGRYRKTRIYQLEQEEGDENLKTYITNYYKGLFGSPESNHFTLDETHIEDISQVSDLDNSFGCF